MKQNIFAIFIWSMVMSAAIFFPAAGNAGLPTPPMPPLVIPAPPPVSLIPGTYAYYAPDVNVELLFYSGFWYRPYGGQWYRSSNYGGPWGFIAPNRVPHALINLPPGYRHVPPGRERIPYGQLNKNWKTWEREKHWDKRGDKVKRNNKKMRGKEERAEHGPEHGPREENMRGHGR